MWPSPQRTQSWGEGEEGRKETIEEEEEEEQEDKQEDKRTQAEEEDKTNMMGRLKKRQAEYSE